MTRIGTAGWSIARGAADAFPAQGSALERYAARLNAVEINSSFYRPHKRSTWERWAASVPDDFRFSVKLTKEATHVRRLVDCAEVIAAFFEDVSGLAGKLGVVLVQLPPSLQFEPEAVASFVTLMRDATDAPIAIEPRHASWAEADALLAELKVVRVAADPPRLGVDDRPGGWTGLRYWRLHGSPDIYRSSYADRLAALAPAVAGGWCIFDNTVTGAALHDALALKAIDEAP